MLRHRILPTLMITVGAFVAGCGSGGSGAPATVPPTSVPPAPTSVSTTEGATIPTVPSSTTVATDPATTLPGTVGLSPDGPWRLVDSAPGITTPGLVYELMPKLWVYLPTQEDLAHGITWTFTEADREIIEAYLQARLVYFQAVTSRPMDFASEGWSTFYVDGGQQFLDLLQPLGAAGQYVDLDAGVVLRPTVLGDERTDSAAVVFDCALDGGVYRRSDGSLAEGSTIGVVPTGFGFRMRVEAGSWKVGKYGSQPEACL
jgi:hypothetical protein